MKSTILKLFVFLALFNTTGANAAEKFVVVTDIDDTIKITNVGDTEEAIINALASRKAFTGMPTLFTEFDRTVDEHKMFYLSGSGTYLKWAVDAFLRKNSFPVYETHLKEKLFEKVYAYKVRTLEEINSKLSVDTKFILIGDDTEHDFEVYDAFQKAHPDKIAQIYIHRITGKPIPAGQLEVITAFDIAKNEFIHDRMSFESTLAVGVSIALEKKSQKIIPDYMRCANETNIPKSTEPTIELISNIISKKIDSICAHR